MELHFTKVRTAKKKKDKAGRKLGRGGNVAEGMHRTADLTMTDNSNFVLWEFSVSASPYSTCSAADQPPGGAPSHHFQLWYGQCPRELLSQEDRQRRAYTKGKNRSQADPWCLNLQ
jgi:hypothetical protein